MRYLYILRSGDVMPLQLALPPTSIKPYKNFVNAAFALRCRPIYSNLVKITLKPVSNGSNDYSVAVFRTVREFAGEELEAVKVYAEGFRKMVASMQEQWAKNQETKGAIVQTDLDNEPLDLPDNDDHFEVGVGVVDGDRDLLPA